MCLTDIVKFEMRKLSISCTASKEEIGSMKISFAVFWFIID